MKQWLKECQNVHEAMAKGMLAYNDYDFVFKCKEASHQQWWTYTGLMFTRSGSGLHCRVWTRGRGSFGTLSSSAKMTRSFERSNGNCTCDTMWRLRTDPVTRRGCYLQAMPLNGKFKLKGCQLSVAVNQTMFDLLEEDGAMGCPGILDCVSSHSHLSCTYSSDQSDFVSLYNWWVYTNEPCNRQCFVWNSNFVHNRF